MFDFLRSEDAKTRHSAVHWLEMAQRIYDFRRDVLSAAELQQLESARSELKKMTKDGSKADALRTGIERLEKALQTCGGRLYPVSSIVENVEFFLVAAIVILGLRAYFVQPFKIPTNSMWPSYYGMTAEVFRPGEEPGLLRKAARILSLGASNYSVVAPADGEVLIPVFANFTPAYTEKTGHSMLIFPATFHEYTFSVGGEMVRLQAPAEWARGNFNDVVQEAFFGKAPHAGLQRLLSQTARKSQSLEQSTMMVQQGDQRGEARVSWIPLGKKVKKGETILSFDILTGDLLFVDRFTYNFVPPKIGSGFVFKTENIRNENMQDLSGRQIEQYYIKRLVGKPGDTLEAKPPGLWRNGKPIDGAAAFAKNTNQEGLYPGYTFATKRYGIEFLTGPGETVTVPPRGYFAMGDNSPNSQDSRYWGFVPDKDVVGRPLFIYYPLTSRWGPAN